MNGRLKIMIIEDEPLMRINIQDSLEAEGYEVNIAETGQKGLSLFRKNMSDILITDLKLPDTDGLQILKEVKQMNPETQVIIITAYGSIDSDWSA